MNGWDAIVVGAGPGGASCARGLTESGLRVLLLEKEKFPRYKPCGGGLTEKVRGIVDLDFSPTIQDTVRRVSLRYGEESASVSPVAAWCVMRDQFDALLTAQAVRAGAEFRDASPVTGIEFDDRGVQVTARGEKIRARYIIGADGVNGVVRRLARIAPHSYYAAALEVEMDVPSSALESWRGTFRLDFGAVPWGYAWIFPKAEHLSVGIGAILDPRRRLDLRTALVRYIASEPTLEKAWEKFSRGHRIPMSHGSGPYDTARTLLVGDAAGLVDPLMAEGIYYAIRSGQVAAKEIVRAAVDDNSDLGAYTERVNRELGSDFRMAGLLSRIVYTAPWLAFRLFAASPAARRAAVAVVSRAGLYGSLPSWIARSVLRRLFRRSKMHLDRQV